MKWSWTSMRERLLARMKQYFDADLSDADVRAIMPTAMTNATRFNAREIRRYPQRGFKPKKIVRYCYRPFDNRWLYWSRRQSCLMRSVPNIFPRIEGNIWLAAVQQNRKSFDPPVVA